MKWGFFRFDRSRWIIFFIIFLLLPFCITYPCLRGPLFSQRPNVCAWQIDYRIFPTFLGVPFMLIDYIFYYCKDVNIFSILYSLSPLIPTMLISLVLSYPINLLHGKRHKISAASKEIVLTAIFTVSIFALSYLGSILMSEVTRHLFRSSVSIIASVLDVIHPWDALIVFSASLIIASIIKFGYSATWKKTFIVWIIYFVVLIIITAIIGVIL